MLLTFYPVTDLLRALQRLYTQQTSSWLNTLVWCTSDGSGRTIRS